MICIPVMKSKIQLEIYESEILKSFVTQSKEETFEFISKMMNKFEYPADTANQLISHLEGYIDTHQECECENEEFIFVDERGNQSRKYHEKLKNKQKHLDIDKIAC